MTVTHKPLVAFSIPSLIVGIVFFFLGMQDWSNWSPLAELLFRMSFALCLVYQLLLWSTGMKGGNTRKSGPMLFVGALYPLFCTMDTIDRLTTLSAALMLEGFMLFSSTLLYIFMFGVSFKKASQ
jgi:hypothetical protein